MSDTSRDPLRHILSTCAAQVLAFSPAILSPLTVGALISGLEIGEVEAGALVTAEFLVMGITSILVAPVSVRIPYRFLALVGGILLLAGHACSATAAGLDELYPWRIMAGMGCGCLAAAVNAAIAQARAPDRLYGLAWAAGYTFTAVFAVVITESNDLITYDIVFGSLAVTLLIFLPLVWFVPDHGKAPASLSLPADSIRSGSMLMVGIIVIGISMMAYYAFLERLAVQVGASAAETGRIVAAAVVAGIIGGLLAAPVARRLGLVTGLCTVSLLHAATITLAVWTDSVIVLGAVAFFEAVLFIIMVPLMLTLAAGIDARGRWAAIAGGVFVLSTAIGPVIGAFLIEGTGYDAIAWIQWPAVLLAVGIFAWVNRSRSGKH